MFPEQAQRHEISIHALREEGDTGGTECRHKKCPFLSTPSARRATLMEAQEANDEQISIHALREEGDLAARHDAQALVDFYPRPPRGGRRKLVNAKVCKRQFLSTPSARRATVAQPMLCAAIKISIHALREEGDALGRHCPQANPISIHALREEGDLNHSCHIMAYARFLSTPSARRATAKTETKSLFSNKLYNILHGFRRALIYNGSKNYPNHAK